MIDTPFRRILPHCTGPLISLYRHLGLRPNAITMAGFALAVLAAFCTALGWTYLAIALWWLSRLLDGTDGIYARSTEQVSDFGGYLDIVLDMAAYGCMVLGFAIWKPEYSAAWIVILFLYILCITSALALGHIEEKHQLGPGDNRSLRLAAGLAEGGETGIAYTAMLVWPGAIMGLAGAWILILVTTIIARTYLAAQRLSVGQTKVN